MSQCQTLDGIYKDADFKRAIDAILKVWKAHRTWCIGLTWSDCDSKTLLVLHCQTGQPRRKSMDARDVLSAPNSFLLTTTKFSMSRLIKNHLTLAECCVDGFICPVLTSIGIGIKYLSECASMEHRMTFGFAFHECQTYCSIITMQSSPNNAF